MVRELRALGFVVHAPDLYAYTDSLVPNLQTGTDVLDLKSLAGYRFIVTNLPYREQAAILAHLLPIAAREGVRVAVLARPKWELGRGAPARQFTRMRSSLEKCRLTKLAEWVRPAIASSRHWFSWFVWSRAGSAKTPFRASLAMRRARVRPVPKWLRRGEATSIATFQNGLIGRIRRLGGS
jgi:hypothetical protein